MLLEVDERALAHILVGLRMLQGEQPNAMRWDQFDGVELYTDEELDDLCEELNFPQETIYIAWDPDQNMVVGWADDYKELCDMVAQLDDVVVKPFLTGR